MKSERLCLCPPARFSGLPRHLHATDAFEPLGVHVCYSDEGRCEAIECASPSLPIFDGKRLLGLPFADVDRFMRRLDAEASVDESGTTSFALGVATYCPAHVEDPTAPVEGVLVFREGYYSSGSHT